MAVRASTSIEEGGDLTRHVRTDDDGWRRPRFLPSRCVDRSTAYGSEVRPPLPEARRR
jgi:hypothetical protein